MHHRLLILLLFALCCHGCGQEQVRRAATVEELRQMGEELHNQQSAEPAPQEPSATAK